MYHPTIFFDPLFVKSIIAGFLLMVGGGGLLLVAGIWAAAAEKDWLGGKPRPGVWRGLCVLGLVAFVGGCAWQIVGYYLIGAVTWQ